MDPWEALEKHVKLKLMQTTSDGGEELNSFLADCSTLVCLLPAQLDVSYLRYPAMAAMFNPSMQHLHFLCPGLRHDYHMVDHEGINFSKVSKTYAGIEAVMMMFLQALYFQENILPAVPSKLCPGVEKISLNQTRLLQHAVRRVLRLYMMMFEFLSGGHTQGRVNQAERRDKAKIDALSRPVQEERALKLSLTKVLELLNKDESFLKSFSSAKHLQCLGHHTAISPGCELTEIVLTPFTGVGLFITKLDFQNNSLAALPDDFFESFPNLVELLLARNSFTSLPSLAQCTTLVHFDVSHNRLSVLNDLEKVKDTLTTLIITDNPFGRLPENVVKCTSLEELQADNIGLVANLADICDKLQALKKLSLNFNKIEKWPTQFPVGLVELGLAGVPFVQLSETASGFSLLNFNTFIASNVMLSKIPEQERIDLYSTGTKKDPWTTMTSVSLSDLNTRLSKQKVYSQLGAGELAGGKGFPSGLPASLFQCKSLQKLNLSNHAFKTLADEVRELTSLQVLDLSHSYQLESISAELATLPLTELHLKDCPMLKTPPEEIIARGFSTIFGYLRRLRMGSVPCKRTKLMMVGLGGAGKTSLVRALTNSSFQAFLDYDENITDGIDISEWNVPVKDSTEPITYSVWDFAGQTVYYNTHQFFLSNRAVYLLLWNIRLGYEHAGLNFWLSSIACHAPLAPILVVGTHCDKVEKTRLPTEELQRRFPQISNFHYVSSYSGEIFQGVQFLHDLGSVQFFNTDFLRSQIVIYPQWIVDVMACVVTVHVGPIQNGKFLHCDMAKVWKDYPPDLHPWLLRLTEEFDLTFPLPDEAANIVPCLLPTTEPKYTWPAVDKENGFRETKMIYVFDYLPAGLFNRAQVRLHEFSTKSLMWKKGSLLNKNNHKALLLQTSDTSVVVKVQGFKPENVLFLVHEVFESLVQQSYSGVHYDFSIPCMDCQAEWSEEPCMFPASKIRRAVEMKAPFLQCDSAFHILAIPELQAIMPPDRSADFDEHLGRSVRELRDLEEAVTTNTFFLYSKKNIPSLAEENSLVHPGKIIEDLRACDIKVSFCDSPETADMETLTLSLKTSQVVMIGMSDEFVEDEQCKNLIAYTKETLHKPILLAVLGKTTKWRDTNVNILLADEVFVKLQDPSRYETKKGELVEKLKLKAGHLKKTANFPKCFISYCWANSKMAKDSGSHSAAGAVGWGDPRKIKEFLESKGISCWLDVERMGTKEGFFEDIAEGLRKAKVMVSCVSNEYADSKNCRMEFRFGVSTLRIPVILAVVGTGYKWERSEVGLMATGNDCPKVNLQYENEAGLLELFALVQDVLSKTTEDSATSETASEMRKIALQEVLELAQRKFLRHLENYSSMLDRDDFPNLLTLDLINETKVKDTVEEEEVKDEEFENEIAKLMEDKTMDQAEQEDKLQKAYDKKKQKDAAVIEKKKPHRQSKYCFKLLCEFEQGWHSVPESISLPDSIRDDEVFLKSVAPYLVRLFAILKHTNIQLSCLTTPEGEQMRNKLEEWCTKMMSEFQEEYTLMLKTVMEADTERTLGGLKRCHMANGKVLWLCEEHQSLSGSKTTERYKDQLESIASKEEEEQKPETTEPTIQESAESAEINKSPVTEDKTARSVSSRTPVRKGAKLKRQTSQACVVM
ncbi:uncharacterized protein LOC121389673 [Gigantopelta aegis]|uniref:uncharacterized protein LOC121389673 n=1 Tax=Gigantopelta aegis TaxID=1735272 RepID=UPI001B889F77|nr:uncharacterized protein LOC121389673 [Gigantopelta aegis]